MAMKPFELQNDVFLTLDKIKPIWLNLINRWFFSSAGTHIPRFQSILLFLVASGFYSFLNLLVRWDFEKESPLSKLEKNRVFCDFHHSLFDNGVFLPFNNENKLNCIWKRIRTNFWAWKFEQEHILDFFLKKHSRPICLHYINWHNHKHMQLQWKNLAEQ